MFPGALSYLGGRGGKVPGMGGCGGTRYSIQVDPTSGALEVGRRPARAGSRGPWTSMFTSNLEGCQLLPGGTMGKKELTAHRVMTPDP